MTTTEFLAVCSGAGMSEIEALNALQDAGVISDECVWAAGIARVDLLRAAEYVKGMSRR